MISRKAPSFWYQPPSIASAALTPLSWVYRAGHKALQARGETYTSKLPVICIGNGVVGGSGKTPAVLALIDILKQAGIASNPAILTRGYGGMEKGPIIVDLEQHGYRDVGDEPLLLARKAMTIVSADRAAGAKLAEKQGADLILMDDGLQNPSLHKTLSLLCVDAKRGFGNGQILPAGPLREPFEQTMERVQGAIVIGNGDANTEDKEQFRASLQAMQIPDTNQPYLAFAGLGHPEKFFQTLRDLGLTVAKTKSFPDHHPYMRKDMLALQKQAQKRGATLITTEKDYVRIPTAFSEDIETLPVDLVFEQPDNVVDCIQRHLGA